MKDVQIVKGDKATFEIELTKGDALVRWLKDGQDLQFSEHVTLYIDGKRQKLKIYNATTDDAGVYSCKVGNQTSKATLTVEEPGIDFVRKLPDVTSVPLDEDVLFTIELSRADAPVQWFRKDKVINDSDKYTIIDEGTVKKLVISGCSVDDTSEYSACVLNMTTTTKLKVEVTEMAPKISADTVTIYKMKKGDDADLYVPYFASPPPSDEWSVNETVIVKNNRIVKTLDEEAAHLKITRVKKEDMGVYNLKLSNSLGEAKIAINLIVGQEPDRPEGPLVITNMGKDSLKIEWKQPKYDGGYEITGYIIESLDPEDGTWALIEVVDNDTFNYTFENLRDDVEYVFRVMAKNEVGISKPLESKPIMVRAFLEKPGIPRGPLEVTGMAKKSFTIQWQPPASDGGSAITEYIVEMKQVSKRAWRTVGSTDGNTSYIHVSELKTDTGYQFKITAKNSIGEGPPYFPEEAITLGDRLSTYFFILIFELMRISESFKNNI